MGQPPFEPEDDRAALPGRAERGDPRSDRRRRRLGARHLRPGKRKVLPVETYRQAFAYIFQGSATFAGASAPFGALREELVGGEETLVRDTVGDRSLVVFDSGDEVVVQAGDEGVRFLLVSGRPLREPIAWHGPIVMNTQAEIRQALPDLRDGSFIR